MRWVKRIAKWLCAGLLAVAALGAIYQQIGGALDARLAPPAREMVAVNGHAVHLRCTGSGTKTYLLDAGAGAGLFEWWRLQPLLAKTGRVCAFDRPGLGWSDPSGGGHDAAASADELAALVRTAKIPAPFIYVGHSLGANIAIVYRKKYPRDVSALVLMEPGNPKDLLEDFHGTRAEAMGQTSDCRFLCRLVGAAAYIGIPRLAAQFLITDGKNLSGDALRQYRASLGRPAQNMALVASYIYALPKTAYETLDVHDFGNTPVLIFASSNRFKGDGFDSDAEYQKWRKAQRTYLASLAAMSTHGSGPIVVPDSTHSSMVMGERGSEFLARQIVHYATPR
jgi:pimeloyl-ACP methyl ester carboxylesterase